MRCEVIALHAEFGGHRVQAEVSIVGAGIQRLVVDGVAIVRGSRTGEPLRTSGTVLVPWPNRVRGARWMLGGERQQLEMTEPSAGNAIHGLLADAAYRVVEVTTGHLVLTTTIRNRPGYPFDLDVCVTYTLVPDGISAVICVVNRGDTTAPVALGVHPYVRVADAGAKDLTLSIDAEQTLLLGNDNLPLSTIDVGGTEFDLRRELALQRAPRHASFTGLNSSSGRVTLRLASDRGRVEVWADERFRWAQLFVTDEFPGMKQGELAIALEPMTAPPDALNSGIDLHWLEPGGSWPRHWGISFVR